MADVLSSFIIFIMLLFFVVISFKYRKQLLEWIAEVRPSVRTSDLDDLAVLKRYGIDTEDAIARIKKRQAEKQAERDALRTTEEPQVKEK